MTIETSPAIGNLMKALLSFQSAVEGVKRDSKNPHFKNSYASLESVVDTARPHLQANGLVFMQAPGRMFDGCIEVSTRIIHAESAEWVQSTMHMPLAKKDPQGAGSALTYAQRYSLMAALGLPPTDDDAETAYDRGGERPRPQASRHDKSAVVVEVMLEVIKDIRTRADVIDWQAKQKAEIDALDDVSRERVLNAARNRVRELPREAA